jgi:GAF domain-containing protein
MSAQQLNVVSMMSKVVLSSSRATNRDEALALITQAAKDCVPGVDSASISVRASDGSFQTLVPTDGLARDGDSAQYQVGEGPCVDAASGEQMIYSGRIGADGRYRRYGPLAADLGVVSQLALQMYTADRSYGGLNLYSRSHHVFDDDARCIAELFAHQGAAAMGHAATVKQLTEALGSRKIIGQAIGIVAERYGVDENVAFGFLTRLSQTSNMKLRTVAAEMVASVNEKAQSPAEGLSAGTANQSHTSIT